MKENFLKKCFYLCWITAGSLMLLIFALREFFDIDIFPNVGWLIFLVGFLMIGFGVAIFIHNVNSFFKKKQ
jgi:hypothetical protein